MLINFNEESSNWHVTHNVPLMASITHYILGIKNKKTNKLYILCMIFTYFHVEAGVCLSVICEFTMNFQAKNSKVDADDSTHPMYFWHAILIN